MKIAIIKEKKEPFDKRVPFSPKQCATIEKKYGVKFVVEPSSHRCFSDEEYMENGIEVNAHIQDCDYFFGVKEVPVDNLIENKSYFFFSHTIKKQAYNQKLMKTLLSKNISMIDYECLKNSAGIRLVAFGRFAGIVGAYNGLRAFGLKKNYYELKPAHLCFDILELFAELNKIRTKNLKILLTGGGRVAQGAIEVLGEAGFNQVDFEEFKIHIGNCFLQLDAYDYNERIDGGEFSFDHFFAHPTEYRSTFSQYLPYPELFIAGAYWDPSAPVLFNLSDIQRDYFGINVIADVTCDINGSVPTTIRSTTIDSPFYDLDRETYQEKSAFSNPTNLTIMAVDNLPCELPRDASVAFGEQLSEHVMPALLNNKRPEIIERATICKSGKLMPNFEYLSDYAY